MSLDLNKLIDELFENVSLINANEIPNIDLYMDQVTTFMDNHMGTSKRYEEDKVLTKTMINNYTKNNLLPPPEKKKYSKEHVVLLSFIYYLKNILSINDIKKLLEPIHEKYFKKDNGIKLEDIYKQITEHELNQVEEIKKEITTRIKESKNIFNDVDQVESEYLQYFSVICSLTFDVYIKKHLIESMIDRIKEPALKQENMAHDKHNK